MYAITTAIPIGNGLDTEEDSRRNHTWNGMEGERLADLNFADDIALMESSWEGMIELTGKVDEVAAKVG